MQRKVNGNEGAASTHPGLDRVRGVVDKATMGLNVLGTLLIVAIMILVNSDVIGRSFFGAPVSGVPEMVSMSIVAIVFLQVAQTFRMGRLTRSEAIIGKLGRQFPRFRAFVEFSFCLCAAGIIGQLLTSSYPLFLKSWSRNTFVGTPGDFSAPIWPVKLVILIGCTALIIQLLVAATTAALEAFGSKHQNREGE